MVNPEDHEKHASQLHELLLQIDENKIASTLAIGELKEARRTVDYGNFDEQSFRVRVKFPMTHETDPEYAIDLCFLIKSPRKLSDL